MALDSATIDDLLARINAYPPYVGAGIEVSRLAEDEITVRMPLTDLNRNLVGTHFGGSLYSMVDPHLMILLIRRLGPDYVVWDKSATIDFEKPGLGTVHAHIHIADDEVAAIRAATETGEKHFPQWSVTIANEDGDVIARVLKTLYVRRKPPRARRSR